MVNSSVAMSIARLVYVTRTPVEDRETPSCKLYLRYEPKK